MLGMQIKDAKSLFFDRPAVTSAMDKVSRGALSGFGAYLRTVARNLLKKRAKGPFDASEPGQPPKRHSGLLHDWLLFSWDQSSQSVVIGPAYLTTKGEDVPETLEYSGVTTITAGKNRGQRKFIEARPYMGPAYDAAEPKLPEFWEQARAKAK
jgi:hypothetical protein